MEEGLFPEGSQELEEDPGGDNSGEEYDTGYKRSMEWDQETGDFVRDSTGRIAEADGYNAFAIWCYKMVQTERGSHMAYISCAFYLEFTVNCAAFPYKFKTRNRFCAWVNHKCFCVCPLQH